MKLAPLPTLPSVLVGGSDTASLLAALAFVEGVARGWSADELRAWVDDSLVQPGYMQRPASVNEQPIGVIVLDGEGGRLTEALGAARTRVVCTLRGFLSAPCDDRFLHAALFRGRVERVAAGARSQWVPKPEVGDSLSDIVLSFFAADMLMRREVYERSLCVCDLCGRVSFDRQLTTSRGCTEHVPHTEGTSGFRRWTA